MIYQPQGGGVGQQDCTLTLRECHKAIEVRQVRVEVQLWGVIDIHHIHSRAHRLTQPHVVRHHKGQSSSPALWLLQAVVVAEGAECRLKLGVVCLGAWQDVGVRVEA